MNLEKRTNVFITLGKFLGQFSSSQYTKDETVPQNDNFYEDMVSLLQRAQSHNGWFSQDNIQFANKSWSLALQEENVSNWLKAYAIEERPAKTIALIMAGNVPLVGFHDFLSVLITGNKALVKLSSNDSLLLPFIANYIKAIEPEFGDYIEFTEEKLTHFDAVIATGSNNTARYFDYYFGKYPNIIRKNRNSVAVLSGNESQEDLEGLANDIFQYFGLGCRNVSKIYTPEDYNFDAFFNAMFTWKHVINDHKYINNYDYNKAVYLMSTDKERGKLLDNEYLLVKEDSKLSSPIAVLFQETYTSLEELKTQLKNKEEAIQCIVSQTGIDKEIDFGLAQSPQLWDYADEVDTISFLINLN